MNQTNKTESKDVYSIVTNRIIELLEKGVVPWQQPWAKAGLPKNLITGKNYRGINVWILASLHYSQNCFLTFKQVKELGGSVKKGEKSCPIVFWKWVEKENKETGKEEKIPFLRYYNVFNITQCEGIPKEKLPPIVERKNDPIKSCEEIIAQMPKQPQIKHNEHRAYYNRTDDYVNMPKVETFVNSESYYATLFHELTHSTGHKERLNRKELLESNGLSSKDYAVEELTAEMGASYLKSYAGIPIQQLENNAAYIQHWLEKLKKDRKFIVHASSQAQKAVDFILNVRNEEKELEFTEKKIEEIDFGRERERELERIREKSHNKELEKCK